MALTAGSIERQVAAIEKGRHGRAGGTVRKLIQFVRRLLAENARLVDDAKRVEESIDVYDQARPDPERLLLMVYADGAIEVYGEKWHAVQILAVPDVHHCNLTKAEEYVLLQAPIPFRDLFWPGKLRATANVKSCVPVTTLMRGRETKKRLPIIKAKIDFQRIENTRHRDAIQNQKAG